MGLCVTRAIMCSPSPWKYTRGSNRLKALPLLCLGRSHESSRPPHPAAQGVVPPWRRDTSAWHCHPPLPHLPGRQSQVCRPAEPHPRCLLSGVGVHCCMSRFYGGVDKGLGRLAAALARRGEGVWPPSLPLTISPHDGSLGTAPR